MTDTSPEHRPDTATPPTSEHVPAGDDSRSGETVAQGVDRMAEGTQHAGVQRPPEEAKPGSSPVEQTRGDTDMTQGQVVEGAGGTPAGSPAAQSQAEPSDPPSSGAAQSMTGARVSDRTAAGEDVPRFHPEAAGRRDALVARLRRPAATLGLAAAFAVLVRWLGRRTARG